MIAIAMRRRLTPGIAALAVIALACLSISLTSKWGSRPASAETSLAPVPSAIPGATATLGAAPDGGLLVNVTVPPSSGVPAAPAAAGAKPAGPAQPENSYELDSADIAWRVLLASEVVADRDPNVVGYTYQGLAEPREGTDPISVMNASNFRHGMLRGAPKNALGVPMAKLGSVSLNDAIAQADSNIAEFTRVAAGVEVIRASVTPVWLDRDANLFALRIQLHVADVTALRERLGDLVSGLPVGLVGSDRAVIEGLATNVTDDHGQGAGWWETERASIGIGVPGPALPGPVPSDVAGKYRNLTGGPDMSVSGSGHAPGGAGSSGASPAGTTRASRAGATTGTVTVAAGRGIGMAMLGQTRREVTARLGAGTRVARGVYTYRQAGIELKVNYARGAVTSVDAGSAKITLGGRPLSRGFTYFKQRTKWSAVACGGSHLLFHYTTRTHGETTVSWRADGALGNILIQATSKPVPGGGCGATR